MTRGLMDDGENRAVRFFLALYGGQRGITVGNMKENLRMAGYSHWPAWVDDPKEYHQHLAKTGAQIWLRHLFDLEKTR